MAITFNNKLDIDKNFHYISPSYSSIYTYHNGVLSTNLRLSNTFNYFEDTAAVGDRLYIGIFHPTNELVFNVGTARNGTITVKWEYFSSVTNTWLTIPGLVDNTNTFSTLGINSITFDMEQMFGWDNDLLPELVGEVQSSYIRCEILTVSGMTEGGAQTTDLLKYADQTITITGNNGGTPWKFSDIYAADIAGGWGVVQKIDESTYFINAHLNISSSGELADYQINITLGKEGLYKVISSASGTAITFGREVGDGIDSDDACIFTQFNLGGRAYDYMYGIIKMYGGFLNIRRTHGWFALGNGSVYKQVNIYINQGVLGGTPTFKRVNFSSFGGIYFFTSPATVYEDCLFNLVTIALDPPYQAAFDGATFIHTSNWRTGFTSTGVKYTSTKHRNCTFSDVANWDFTKDYNLLYRTENFIGYSVDVKVLDENNIPIPNASVKLKNKVGSVLYENTGVATNGIIDYTAWGDTSIIVVDGSIFTIGQLIRIDFEVMKITNIVGNTLTVLRAQEGTFIGQHAINSSVDIWTKLDKEVTDLNGAINSHWVIAENRFGFETNTPAPYNDGEENLEEYGPFTLEVQANGYKDYTSTFTLDKKFDEIITLKKIFIKDFNIIRN